MKVGFTGTRDGMTPEQCESFSRFISELPQFEEFRHGACVGADADAVEILVDIRKVTDMDARTLRIIAHPGDWGPLTDLNATAFSHTVMPSKRMLDRNRDIVDDSDILVACPRGPEERRSGTWATIRYARKCGKPVVIVWPNGTVERISNAQT